MAPLSEGEGVRLELKGMLRAVPDFPKPGILFYDIGPLLADGRVFAAAVEEMVALARPFAPGVLAAIESRGFLLASAMALRLGCGLILLRKGGKLPGEVVTLSYELEYGVDSLQGQEGMVARGVSVVVVDDLVATGGTLAASLSLVRRLGLKVAAAVVLIELTSLRGRRLDVDLRSVLEISG